MNFTHLFLALRARYKIVILILAVTVAAAVAISALMPKVYQASTSLVLNTKGVDPVPGETLPVQRGTAAAPQGFPPDAGTLPP